MFDEDDPDAWARRAAALKAAGRGDEAIAAYRQALTLRPDWPEALNDLANLLVDRDCAAQAIDLYCRALICRPDWPLALNNLGTAWLKLDRPQAAADCHRRALAQNPADARAHCYLGDACARQGCYDQAIASYGASLAIDPDNYEAHNNLGNALSELNRLNEAIACYRRALALRPDLFHIHTNLGQALLTVGDLPAGWTELEFRWRVAGELAAAMAAGPPPDVWYGRDVRGRTVLVHCEQGFGDTIHFVRYVPLLAARGARIIVRCQRELRCLLQTLDGVDRVVLRDQPPPPFDLHAMLLSLPPAFATTLDTIPNRVPYLRPPEDARRAWQARVVRGDGQLNVGLVWAGNPRQKNDHQRSMPFALLAPLGQIPGVRFHSLQKGSAAQQQMRRPEVARLRLVDWTDELTDFAQTAALIERLDLVISVDTAVAHLAGALGKPVWVLLTYAADWRYLLNRDDSPWYPTMRLFRQSTHGDWTGVVQRVAAALRQLQATR